MNDTIVALATPHGVGAIAIVRISGSASLSILSALSPQLTPIPRYAHLTTLYGASGTLIDQALVLYFQAPASYTGEDIVEFQCHGGSIVATELIGRILELGARLAQPGEFTKRAFLAGKMDMTQVEAVTALIGVQSVEAARLLARQLKGALGAQVGRIRGELIEALAFSEVLIDYAEEDIPEDTQAQVIERIEAIRGELSVAVRASKSREGLMQGFRLAIVGKPNVGKSSLLNALLAYERAIVSEIPGTTRDLIEERLRIGTHLVRIIDTAGIRETADSIERIGIERARSAVEEAEVILALFDASRPWDADDDEIVKILSAYEKDKDILVIINKSDLSSMWERPFAWPSVRLSVHRDVAAVVDALEARLDRHESAEELFLVSVRQVEAVVRTMEALQLSVEPLVRGELELFSYHINDALAALATITEPYELDEMFDKMFSEFCLGK